MHQDDLRRVGLPKGSTAGGPAPGALPVLPPLGALVEIAILLGPAILLEWLWSPFPDISNLQPHPYWLPVLLLSLQYGTVSGLLTAAVAIAGSALIGWPEPDIGENHFAYLVRVWTQPALWVAAALVLGQFRMRQIENKVELRQAVADLAGKNAALTTFAKDLRRRCDELERVVVMRPATSASATLDALAAAGRGDAGNLPRLLTGVLGAAIPRGAVSLFRVDGRRLVLVTRQGGEMEAHRAEFRAGDALFEAVVTGRQAVSVLDAPGEAALAGQGLAAVPMMAPETGAVAGMLKLERVDPDWLDRRTCDRLAVVAAHLVGPMLREHDRPAAIEEARRPWRTLRWLPGGRHGQPRTLEATTSVEPKSTAG